MTALLAAPEGPTMAPPTTTSTTAPGRVLEVLCVPYGITTTWVNLPGFPGGERFRQGAFAALVAGGPRAAAKVRLTDSHLDGVDRRPIGEGVEFVETPDGLVGKFRIYNTPEGRSGWENVREGTYGGASISFPGSDAKATTARRVASPRGDVREVLRTRLVHVSLVDQPAYVGAGVMALHETDAEGNTTTTEIGFVDPDDYPTPIRLLPPAPVATSPSPAAASTSGARRPTDAELGAWARARRGTPMPGPTLAPRTLADMLVTDARAVREARRARLYDVAWREYPGAYWDQWAVVDWMEARADLTRSREYVWALAEIAGVPHTDYCDYCRTKRSDTSPCKYPRLTL